MKTRTGLQLSGGGVLAVENGGTGQSNLDSVTVGNAKKATQDANGNVIDETYATKTELEEVVDNATKITVGSTSTGEPGTEANVVNSGTPSDAILDFTIPRGDPGEQGPKGDGYLIKRTSSGLTGGISVGDTFSNMPLSSLNRTPKTGEVFLFVGYGMESGIIPKQNGRSFVCVAEVTGTTDDSFSCTVKSSIETTGKNGTTFTPSVDASGNLSWTNDGDKENPPTVNIKGQAGDPGLTPEQIQMFQYLAQHMTIDQNTGKVTFSLEIVAPSFNAVTEE